MRDIRTGTKPVKPTGAGTVGAAAGAAAPKKKPPRPFHVAALKRADKVAKAQRIKQQRIDQARNQRSALAGPAAARVRSVVNPPRHAQHGSLLSALDTVGQYTVGLGLVKPSHMLGTALAKTGIHTSLPQDKPPHRPSVQTIRRAMAGDKQALSTIEGAHSVGMVPFVPGSVGGKALRAELKAHPVRNAFHANIDKTVADVRMAKKIKQTFDQQTLRAAKRAGMRPGELLDKGGQSEAAQKVMAGMSAGRAQTLRRQQQELYHAERSRRAQVGSEALAKEPGSAGIKAAKAELRGALPKLEYQGMRGVTDKEMENLNVAISTHPKLLLYEKMHVADALRAAREGVVPTDYDRKLIRKAFGLEFDKQMMAGQTGLQKFQHAAIETANIPRAVMSSADISGPGRQGAVALTRHPIITGRNLRPMLKSYRSERAYAARRVRLEANPYFHEAKDHGLAVTDMEHSLGAREEPFQSNYAERIPGIGHLVRPAGRAYTDFLSNSRLDIYSHLRQLAEKQGHHLDDKGLRDLTGYINSATGRGNLGRFERSAVGLNSFFFSPRLIASRLDFLLPWKYAGLDPFVRQQKLRAAAQFGGTLATMLYLADQVPGVQVAIDPRSTDFGKVRIGNTRLDFTGGFQQYARTAVQMAMQQKINPATGEADKANSVDTFWRFVRAKFAPSFGAGFDVATRTQYSGQPLDWKQEIASHTLPLGWQDAYTLAHKPGTPVFSPGSYPPEAIAKGLAGYGVSATGVGVQSYPQAKPKYPGYGGPGYQGFRLELKHALKQHNATLSPEINLLLKVREERDTQSKLAGKTPADHLAADVTLLVKYKAMPHDEARAMIEWVRGLPDNKVNHQKISNARAMLSREYFDPGGKLTKMVKFFRENGSPNLELP